MVDLNKTIMNAQVFNVLNKKDYNSEQEFYKNEQMIMSTCMAIVDTENEAEVLGAVVISANIDSLYESLEDIKGQVYLLSLITSLLVGLLSFFTSSFITRPLKTVMKFVQKVTNGQLDQKIELRGKDEIAELRQKYIVLFGISNQTTS